jgi:hypothetical protein
VTDVIQIAAAVANWKCLYSLSVNYVEQLATMIQNNKSTLYVNWQHLQEVNLGTIGRLLCTPNLLYSPRQL